MDKILIALDPLCAPLWTDNYSRQTRPSIVQRTYFCKVEAHNRVTNTATLMEEDSSIGI
jgi:hypothetical protein